MTLDRNPHGLDIARDTSDHDSALDVVAVEFIDPAIRQLFGRARDIPRKHRPDHFHPILLASLLFGALLLSKGLEERRREEVHVRIGDVEVPPGCFHKAVFITEPAVPRPRRCGHPARAKPPPTGRSVRPLRPPCRLRRPRERPAWSSRRSPYRRRVRRYGGGTTDGAAGRGL